MHTEFLLKKIAEWLVTKKWNCQTSVVTSSSYRVNKEEEEGMKNRSTTKVTFEISPENKSYAQVTLEFYDWNCDQYSTSHGEVIVTFPQTCHEDCLGDMLYAASMTPILLADIKRHIKYWSEMLEREQSNLEYNGDLDVARATLQEKKEKIAARQYPQEYYGAFSHCTVDPSVEVQDYLLNNSPLFIYR